jgi:hypothetical protein
VRDVRWLVLLAAACAGISCSASRDLSPSRDASAQSDADIDASDAAVDAGLDLDGEQDPNAYPANHGRIPRIDNLGGPVLSSMKLVTVTFQGDAWRAELEAEGDALVVSEWWRAVGTEYGVSEGVSGGHVVLADTVSGQAMNDEDFPAFLEAHVRSGELPAPDASTLYLFYFPAAADVLFARGALQSCVDFLGYHSETTIALEAGTSPVLYGVVARCSGFGADTKKYVSVSASHAMIEAATDPHPSTAPAYQLATNDAWLTGGSSATRNEVGDLCGFRRSTDSAGVPAQRVWSNAAAAATRPPCVPALPSEIWFGAAVRTDLQLIDVHKSYGYVIVPRGESRDVDIDVFSGAPLARDVSLYVGRDRGATDPRNLDPLLRGIVATLSRTTAHNGNRVVMTLAAPPAAPPGDYPFVVRSVLDAQTSYDWPVIVRVK